MTATAHELYRQNTLAGLLELREVAWNDTDEHGHLRDPQQLMVIGTAINWKRAVRLYGPVDEPGSVPGESEITAGKCPCCEKQRQTIAHRRRHCNYPGGDENQTNWLTSCAVCFHQDCARFSEQEADYRWDKL